MKKRSKPIPKSSEIMKIVVFMETKCGIMLSDMQSFAELLKDSVKADMRKETNDDHSPNCKFVNGIIMEIIEKKDEYKTDIHFSNNCLKKKINYPEKNIIFSYIATMFPDRMRSYGQTYFTELKQKIDPDKKEVLTKLDDMLEKWNDKIDKLQGLLKNPPSPRSFVVNESFSIDDDFDDDFDDDQNFDMKFPSYDDDDDDFCFEIEYNYKGVEKSILRDL